MRKARTAAATTNGSSSAQMERPPSHVATIRRTVEAKGVMAKPSSRSLAMISASVRPGSSETTMSVLLGPASAGTACADSFASARDHSSCKAATLA